MPHGLRHVFTLCLTRSGSRICFNKCSSGQTKVCKINLRVKRCASCQKRLESRRTAQDIGSFQKSDVIAGFMQSEKRMVQPAKDLAQRNRVGINAKRLQTLSQFDRVVEFGKKKRRALSGVELALSGAQLHEHDR